MLHVTFSVMEFQVFPGAGGKRTLRTGMAVVKMRLNVVYQGDFKLSLLLTYGALPGVGTSSLQQLLDFTFDPLVDILIFSVRKLHFESVHPFFSLIPVVKVLMLVPLTSC